MIVLTGLLWVSRAAQKGIEDLQRTAIPKDVFLFPLEIRAKARAEFAQSGQKGEHKCHRSNLFSQRAPSRFLQGASRRKVSALQLVPVLAPWALRLWTVMLSPAQPRAHLQTEWASADHNSRISQSEIQLPRGLSLRGDFTFLPASAPRCAGIFC